ncbi:unnamed protein product, partial [Porites lobata]
EQVQRKASSTYLRQAQRIGKRHSVLRTGTAKGQLNVFRTGTAYRGQAQRIEDRTGTAYRGQPHCIEEKHSVSRTGTAYPGPARGTENQEPHNPLPAGQNMAALQSSTICCACPRYAVLVLNAMWLSSICRACPRYAVPFLNTPCLS